MPLLPRLSSLWRNLFHKSRKEREITEDIDAYLEMLIGLRKNHSFPVLVGALLVCVSVFVGCATQPQDVPTLLERYRQKWNLPALAGAIVTSQGIVAVGAVGARKHGDATPVTLDDQFHLGSDTKSMTATLLAILVEEGKLSWDATLAQALPELAESMHPAYREVTIEQILAHRAGFRRDIPTSQHAREDLYRLPGTLREQRWAKAKEILQEPPELRPGSQFQYSNLGYVMAGVVAERIADASWEELMTQRLFTPLGMSACGFGAMGAPGRVDQPWQHTFDGKRHVALEPGPMSDNPLLIGPAGTVHCSISDWGKYLAAHLRGERGQGGILKAETFKNLNVPNFGRGYRV